MFWRPTFGCTQKNRNLSKGHILSVMASNVALIVGVTGIVGLPLAQQLLDKKWKVYGISRRTADYIPSGVKHIALDVTKKEDCEEKLRELTDVTHVFFVVWVNCGPVKENCIVNKTLVSFTW